MRNLYIYISNFYLKIKFKKNVINQIDNNYIQKVKISIVDFHRKFKLMNHDQLDNEIEYLRSQLRKKEDENKALKEDK